MPRRTILLLVVVGVVLSFIGHWLEHIGEHAPIPDVSALWIIPFVLLLASIALLPFIARHFWEKHYPLVSIGLGAVVAIYYLFFLPSGAPAGGAAGFLAQHAGGAMAKSLGEYASFILMLAALFIICGGILVRVRVEATPAVNTSLLLAGAILANVFGTTGAAMILIRPYLRINKGHIKPYHVVFFIFIVANVGGSLTPIGDPPLFLGFLKGVPFWWVFEHCWPMWLACVLPLLAVFFTMDTLSTRRMPQPSSDDDDLGPAVSIYGVSNLLLIVVVLAAVLLHSQLVHILNIPWRELAMVVAIGLSLWSTPHAIHVENKFNFMPIREVALLFIGIFATMVPALNYLAIHAQSPQLAESLRTPGNFYFASGFLSSTLDNAPTYVTFLETGLGRIDKAQIELVARVVKDPQKTRPTEADYAEFFATHFAKYPTQADQQAFRQDTEQVITQGVIKYHGEEAMTGKLTHDQIRVSFMLGREEMNWHLIAVSLGAVFFGAMTYIGNGPNFMVKSIAENSGVKCPSFFGYIGMYALPILLPVLVLIWALFLRSHSP